MLKNQIKVGGLYRASVSGRVVTVRVDEIDNDAMGRWKGSDYSGRSKGFGRATRYACTNLATGRKIQIKSAAKFRSEVTPTTGAASTTE